MLRRMVIYDKYNIHSCMPFIRVNKIKDKRHLKQQVKAKKLLLFLLSFNMDNTNANQVELLAINVVDLNKGEIFK